MDCAWLDHPIQDCESSQPNHTLAYRRNSLSRMVTLQWTCDYIGEQCAKHPAQAAKRVRWRLARAPLSLCISSLSGKKKKVC